MSFKDIYTNTVDATKSYTFKQSCISSKADILFLPVSLRWWE